MASKRISPDCSAHRVKLCDHNLRACNLVKIKRLTGGNRSLSDAVNYIVEDWYDKNKVKLMMD